MLACSPGQSGPIAADGGDEIVRWVLSDKLREISGLALTRDQRLLAMGDEQAIVYEYDYINGALVKAFAFGKPAIRGDFEGIAVLHDKVWLLTSQGDIYSAPEGDDGQRVEYERYKLKSNCEFEGLAADELNDILILICKNASKKKDRRLFEWSVTDKPQSVRLPEEAMSASIGSSRVHPSGIEIDPATGNLIVVASREKTVFSLGRDGQLIDVIMHLDADRHQQPEGVTITRDGQLLIADEAGNGPATLTVYRAEHFRHVQ